MSSREYKCAVKCRNGREVQSWRRHRLIQGRALVVPKNTRWAARPKNEMSSRTFPGLDKIPSLLLAIFPLATMQIRRNADPEAASPVAHTIALSTKSSVHNIVTYAKSLPDRGCGNNGSWRLESMQIATLRRNQPSVRHGSCVSSASGLPR